MATIGPVQPGGSYLLPPPGDKKLSRRRKASYEQTSDAAEAEFSESNSSDEELDATVLARFPAGTGPINWLARLIFQTYHTVLRPKLGRIVDLLA